MEKLIPLRRVFGATSCAVALFAATGLSSGVASAAPVNNECLRDALEYCQNEAEVGTPEFSACLAHYKAVFCPN
jgi:hypothetical protein